MIIDSVVMNDTYGCIVGDGLSDDAYVTPVIRPLRILYFLAIPS